MGSSPKLLITDDIGARRPRSVFGPHADPHRDQDLAVGVDGGGGFGHVRLEPLPGNLAAPVVFVDPIRLVAEVNAPQPRIIPVANHEGNHVIRHHGINLAAVRKHASPIEMMAMRIGEVVKGNERGFNIDLSLPGESKQSVEVPPECRCAARHITLGVNVDSRLAIAGNPYAGGVDAVLVQLLQVLVAPVRVELAPKLIPAIPGRINAVDPEPVRAGHELRFGDRNPVAKRGVGLLWTGAAEQGHKKPRGKLAVSERQ